MTPQEKYNRQNTVMFSMRLNYRYDGYLIDMLQTSDNRQGLIKAALAEYYDAHRQEIEARIKQRGNK